MKELCYLCFVLLGLLSTSDGYNVLMYVMFGSQSHKSAFMPLANHLAQQGNQLTIVTVSRSTYQSANIEEIVVEVFDKNDQTAQSFNNYNPFKAKQNVWDMMKLVQNFISDGCRRFWENKKIKDFVNDSTRHYDVVLLDGIFNECGLPLAHKFGAPYIFLYPGKVVGYLGWLHNLPVPASYLPTISNDVVIPPMTFLQRVTNSLTLAGFLIGQHYHLNSVNEMLVRVVPFKSPHLIDMAANASLIFSNEHPAFNYPRPLMPNIIPIGGIGTKRGKQTLPEELQDFMDNAGEGVIYFSFGSVISMRDVPMEIKVAFCNAFATLPQRIIWKHESPEELGKLPPNIKLVKWAPQQEILAHSKALSFISHGGIASLTESLSHGVPLIMVPFFADQPYNTAIGVFKGFAVYLPKDNLTQSGILAALHELLSNPKYKENAVKTHNILIDNLAPPLETAQYWIEYAIRHKGAPHLKNEIASRLHIFQYFLIDVIFFIILVVFLAFSLVFVLCKLLISLIYWVCRLKVKSNISDSKRKKTN